MNERKRFTKSHYMPKLNAYFLEQKARIKYNIYTRRKEGHDDDGILRKEV